MQQLSKPVSKQNNFPVRLSPFPSDVFAVLFSHRNPLSSENTSYIQPFSFPQSNKPCPLQTGHSELLWYNWYNLKNVNELISIIFMLFIYALDRMLGACRRFSEALNERHRNEKDASDTASVRND